MNYISIEEKQKTMTQVTHYLDIRLLGSYEKDPRCIHPFLHRHRIRNRRRSRLVVKISLGHVGFEKPAGYNPVREAQQVIRDTNHNVKGGIYIEVIDLGLMNICAK